MASSPEFALAVAQANGFRGALNDLQKDDQITVGPLPIEVSHHTSRDKAHNSQDRLYNIQDRVQMQLLGTDLDKVEEMNTVSLDWKKAEPTSDDGLDADDHSDVSAEHEDDADDADDSDEEDGQGEEDADKIEVAHLRARRGRQNPKRSRTEQARREAAGLERVQREEARVRANTEREARRSKAQERSDTKREQEHLDIERRARDVEESRLRAQEEQEEGRQREQDESPPTTTETERADGAPSTAQTVRHPEQSASTNTQNTYTTLPLIQPVNAIVLPELPSSPLRLTDIFIDNASLQRTADEILAMPAIADFSAEKKSVLIEFLGTLFDSASYWRLRQSIFKMISKAGFGSERMEDVQSHGVNPSTTPSTKMSDPPEIMANYLSIWRSSLDFNQQTASTGAIIALKMHNDMQSYLYWLQLGSIWRAGRAGYQDPDLPTEDNGGTRHGLHTDLLYNTDAPIRPEDAKAVMDFLDSEMERRSGELGIIDANEKKNRTSGLLRVLVAPYLGYTILMEAGKGQGSRRAKIQSEDSTTRMFHKIWNNINVRGKTISVLCKGLGRGALLVVKRTHLTTLGSNVFKLIVPILVRNHGNVLILIFRMIHKRFFLPVQKQIRIHYADVGALMQIYSQEGLGSACAAHPQGLKGILELEGQNIGEALLALGQTPGDGLDATSAREDIAPEDEKVDDIFDADELISEQQAAFQQAVIQQQDESLRGLGDSRKRTPVGSLADNAGRSPKRRG
ncbi:MAG: hypothetical protein Q9223_000863 [Gallowayella weberi]